LLMLIVHQQCLTNDIFVIRKATIFFVSYYTNTPNIKGGFAYDKTDVATI